MIIAWINFIVLVVSSLLILYFYAKSVSPAALEQKVGPGSYALCARYRLIASIFMVVTVANYVIYAFYPLPIPLPQTFPWHWWISALIAVLIAAPAGYLLWRGAKDAGKETMTPKKEHTMYGGIYEKIRHPQAVGEVFLWWPIAFLLHSPFLVLFSFIWLPIFYVMAMAEERDLIVRYGQAYKDYCKRTGAFFPNRKNKKGS